MKKTIFILVIILLFNFTACNKNNIKIENDIKIWTATGTEKILKDKIYERNDDIFEISAFKNEYESAQIIITPSKNVKNYTIDLNDLVHTNGSDILEKTNFTIYNQKYIYVDDVKNTSINMEQGYYPDALLPFEKACEYKENQIEAENNQGIWITLKVPKNQKEGIYTGKFNIKVDDDEYSVNAKIEIYNYVLSDEVHVKTSYGLYQDIIGYGEQDTTDEMFEKYVDFMLDYRISSQHLPKTSLYSNPSTDEALEDFLDMAVKYTNDIRCSNYNIPYHHIYQNYDDSNAGLSVDIEFYTKYITAMAERSMEEGINLFDKAGTYFLFFDEAVINNMMDTANFALKQVNQANQDISNALETSLTGDIELKNKVIYKVRNMEHKLVGNYTDLLETEALYVPTIDQYNLEENREKYNNAKDEFYGEDGELWAYHCMNPLAPYPTVHIDDILLSSRIMGWMMKDYNITGSLYWQSALYSWREGSVGDLQLQNYYETPLRFPQANGDGFLLYPGRQYGIYGPVGTNRLHSLRDGFEDYELLYSLQQLYKQAGMSDESYSDLIKLLTQRLYSGARVEHNEHLVDDFSSIRANLAELLELAQNGIFYENTDESLTKSIISFRTDTNVRLYSDNTEIIGNSYQDSKLFTIVKKLDKSVNFANLKFVISEKEFNVNLFLGYKRTVYGDSAFEDNLSVSSSLQIEKTSIDDEDGYRIFGDIEDGKLDINLSDFNIGKDNSYFTFNIFNANENTKISLYTKTKNKSSVYLPYTTIKLEKGWNYIKIETGTIDFDNLGDLIQLRMKFSCSSVNVFFANLIIGG